MGIMRYIGDDMLKVVSRRIHAMMSAEQVLQELSTQNVGYYKYVSVNGQYRFCDATTSFEDHRSLANGDEVQSAATIKLYPDGIKIEGYSSTLKIGPSESDCTDLPKLFGRPLIDFR